MDSGSTPLRNARHELYCQARAEGMSQLNSYITAGYAGGNKSNASQMDKRDDVQARVKYLLSEKAKAVAEATAIAAAETTKRVAISKEWVLNELLEVAAMGKATTPVLDKDGNPSGEYKQNLAAANKALELIGKEIGMFVERREVRAGALDEIPYDEREASLEIVREAIRRAREPA